MSPIAFRRFIILLYFLNSLFLVSCSNNATTGNSDRIHPYAKNPHYWQYKGEPVLLVGGTIDDNLFQLPFLKEHLDTLASVGGNYIRNTMSSRVDKGFEVYRFKQLPDGQYDLDQWNEKYWTRFHNLLQWTFERDIIVQIEVWDRFDYSREHWLTSPWNPVNNINYTFEETGFEPEYPKHPSGDLQPFFHSIPGMNEYDLKYEVFRKYQEKYVEKLLSYSLNYGNVLYCMNNETSTSPKWGQYWMQFIRGKASEKGVEVYVTDMFDDFWKAEESSNVRLVFDNPNIYSFIDISQVNSRNFNQTHWDRMQWLLAQTKAHPRPCTHTKIYGSGNTSWGSGMPEDGVERFWRNIIGGSASARFHRPWTGNGLKPIAQASIKAVRKMETLIKMWEVEPHMELLSERENDEAYLAAQQGEKYALYFTDGGSVGLDLSACRGTFMLKWIDISTGEWGTESNISAGKIVNISTPKQGGWVAAIVRE